MAAYDVKDARDRLKAETRAALLGAAGRILAEEGLAALTVRRAAAEVGASAKLVYTLFGGKDGLLEALYLDGFEGLARAVDSASRAAPPNAQLAAMAQAYRRYALTHPDRYAVMFGDAGAGFSPSPEARRRAWSTFAALPRALSELHPEHPPDQVETEARALWAAMHGAVSLELRGLLGAAPLPDRIYARAVASALRGA